MTRFVEIPDHIVVREVGGQSVIFDMQTEKYFGLDDVGTRLLGLLREGSDVSSAIDRLVQEYDATTEQVGADVDELLDSLRQHGLVHVVDNG